MAEEKQAGFKSGFVSLIGRPNAGKSTLLNSILGEKIAIISPRPQTTRNRILGIKNLPAGQIIFIDTPGVHHSRMRLNKSMVKTALATLEEVDLVCFLIEADRPENDENDLILKNLKRAGKTVVLAINKIDLVSPGELLPVIGRYSQVFPFREIIPISALTGNGIDILTREILAILPEGPALFPEDMVTDQTERFLVAEFIREKILYRTREEIPYSTAVIIDEFKEREEKNLVAVRATILVERDSQKGILIGEKGRALKEIGRSARGEIESFLGARVFLELWVKVEKNWREDPRALRRLGFE